MTALSTYLEGKLSADGLGGIWNETLKCVCTRERLMPCGAARPDCVPVFWWQCKGCPEASEDGSGCEYEGGGINFAPNDGCFRAQRQS